MSKEDLIAKLTKFQMKFSHANNSVTIKLGFSQEVQVVFLENTNITITDRLTCWNPLSGLWNMNLRKTLIMNFLSNCLFALLLITFVLLDLEEGFGIITMFLVWSWGFSIFWSTYYLIKLENFKRTLINWLDD